VKTLPRRNFVLPLHWDRLVLVCGVVLLVGGCSDSTESAKPVVVATPVDPATAGSITVLVNYDGAVPARQVVNMRSAPQCTAAHSEPVYDQSLLVENGHLVNAVVWIKGGLDKWVFAPPSTPGLVDQKGCVYTPHVSAAMVNQAVEFENSDPEPHNVHGTPAALPAWNFILSFKGAKRTLTFDKPEVAVPVGCDIHPWMRAYVAIVPNPYFGVTGANGLVTLTNVPPGNYVVAAWQEKLGVKEQHVTLEPKGTAQVTFTFGG
jgi:hypothetical protein